MAGRKIDNREQVKATILQALENGAYEKDACAEAGISEDTLARWQKQDAAFADQASRARARGWVSDLAGIRKAGIDGDWRAFAEHLDRTGSPYRKSTDINLNVKQVQERAERIAAALGMSVEEVIAEAESIVAGVSRP